jgi:hypothetical protein
VDKTENIYQMVKNPKGVYFLSRPRRFGKSLLISTLEQIFSGNKELFKDLWIYKSDYEWKKHPVIRIDFSSIKPKTEDELIQVIIDKIDTIAKKNSIKLEKRTYYQKFEELIYKLADKKNIVILIDEYDKPLIDNIDNLKLAKEFREILQGFYSVIKASDQYVRFVLLTGISKFSKMSIFSGLNNLRDLTMSSGYSTLLGLTQSEIERYFDKYIDVLVEDLGKKREEILENIKKWYNGYRFSEKEHRVYNPFSTLLLFEERKFKNYWFATGTPSFLVKLLKDSKGGYNLENIVDQNYGEAAFGSYELDSLDIVPLLFQSGYLTIKAYQEILDNKYLYTLDFPNKEVKDSFNEYVLDH